jgi:hypothetical protein
MLRKLQKTPGRHEVLYFYVFMVKISCLVDRLLSDYKIESAF